MRVSEVMTQKIIAVRRSTTLAELIELFRHFHSFPLVPVVDEHNALIGVVSFRRIIEAFCTSGQDILKTIPPSPHPCSHTTQISLLPRPAS